MTRSDRLAALSAALSFVTLAVVTYVAARPAVAPPPSSASGSVTMGADVRTHLDRYSAALGEGKYVEAVDLLNPPNREAVLAFHRQLTEKGGRFEGVDVLGARVIGQNLLGLELLVRFEKYTVTLFVAYARAGDTWKVRSFELSDSHVGLLRTMPLVPVSEKKPQ